MNRATTGFETELKGGTELANVMLGEFAVEKLIPAEETAGSEALAADSEYARRGGTLAGIDFTDVPVLLDGGPTRTAARLLVSAAFLSWELMRPKAAFCEPATSWC